MALSDYCRRAKAPATAGEVREALALLGEGDDFRVKDLAEGDPEATPLGPFAVVDVLLGTPAAQAAVRQQSGYYEVVQELARVREEKTPLPAPAPSAPSFVPPPAPAATAARGRRDDEASVADRIAPRKRAPGGEEPAETSAQALADAPVFLRKDLPRGRGRFTTVGAARTSLQELLRPGSKATLEELVGQHEHRLGLHRALATQYSGARGQELTVAEVEGALREHGLLDALAERERGRVLATYQEQRGAAGRVAWALGLSPTELTQLERSLGLKDEVEAVRERFRREAMAPSTLTQRLDLLGREKYLRDLGLTRRYEDATRKELEQLLAELPENGPGTLYEVSDYIARQKGAPTELLVRAFERLGFKEWPPRRRGGRTPQPSA